MNPIRRFFDFLKACAFRAAAAAPPFWDRMKFYLNWLIGFTLAIQPEAVNTYNDWVSTGLEVQPWMGVILRLLAGAAVGARFLARVPVDDQALTRRQKERLEELEAMALAKTPPPLK